MECRTDGVMRRPTSPQSSCGKFSSSVCVQIREDTIFSLSPASPEQIVLLAHQIACAPTATPTAKAPNNANRRPTKLAADQPCSASQLVSDGLCSGAQFVSVRVALTTIIVQWLYPCNADCDFRKTFAPGTSE